MKVVKNKYEIDGKLFDDLTGLQDLKEGTIIASVLVVEEVKEEDDKSGVKLGGEKEEEKEEEQPKVGLTPDEEAELKK